MLRTEIGSGASNRSLVEVEQRREALNAGIALPGLLVEMIDNGGRYRLVST